MSKENYDSFIFTHIPKCGGTSFRKYINDCALDSGIDSEKIYIPGFNGIENNKNIPELNDDELYDLQNKSLKIIANHAKYEVELDYSLNVNDPFYFTILRNPIERFISHYNFFYYKLGYSGCKGKTLEDLGAEKLDHIINHLSNVQVTYLSNIKHKKIVGWKNMLKLAKYNLMMEYDCYGLIEDMKRTLKILKKRKPEWLTLDQEFPILNTSNSHKFKVSDEVIEKIRDANIWDILLYDFAKENFKKSNDNKLAKKAHAE